MNKDLKQEIMTIVDGRIGDRWGELIEALIEGKLIKLLNHRNINVTSSYKNGLFVIKATGDSAWILNKEDFKPQNFANN